MRNTISSSLVIVAGLISAIGLLSFGANRLFDPKSEGVLLAINAYRGVVDRLPLEWFAEFAVRIVKALIPTKITLDPDWKYLIVPVLFYFSSEAKVYMLKERRLSALISMMIGILLSLVLAVAISLIATDGMPISVIATVLAFVAYGVLVSAIDPALKESEYGWQESFSYYLIRYPAIDAVVGLIIIGLATFYPGKDRNIGLILAYLIILMFRDFTVATIGALRDTKICLPWWRKISLWSSFHLGLNKLSTFSMAAILLLLDQASG